MSDFKGIYVVFHARSVCHCHCFDVLQLPAGIAKCCNILHSSPAASIRWVLFSCEILIAAPSLVIV